MKHFKSVVLVGLVMVFSIAGSVFAQGGGQGKGGQGAAPMMGCQQRFDAMDINKDGQVSKVKTLPARALNKSLFRKWHLNKLPLMRLKMPILPCDCIKC